MSVFCFRLTIVIYSLGSARLMMPTSELVQRLYCQIESGANANDSYLPYTTNTWIPSRINVSPASLFKGPPLYTCAIRLRKQSRTWKLTLTMPCTCAVSCWIRAGFLDHVYSGPSVKEFEIRIRNTQTDLSKERWAKYEVGFRVEGALDDIIRGERYSR